MIPNSNQKKIKKSPKETKYKFALNPKYTIKCKYQIYNSVGLNYNDVLGAIFAASRQIFASCNLDLLQRQKKVGRIQAELIKNNEKISSGYVNIPLDCELEPVLLIAAAVELIPTVGPFNAIFKVDQILQTSANRLANLMERAIDLYKNKMKQPLSMVKYRQTLKSQIQKVSVVGLPDGLWAGLNYKSNEIIVVEGRNDVKNLINYGWTNVISCDGLNMPQSITKYLLNKNVILLFDGDRGGTFILEKIEKYLNDCAKVTVSQVEKGIKIEDANAENIAKALNMAVEHVTGLKTYYTN